MKRITVAALILTSIAGIGGSTSLYDHETTLLSECDVFDEADTQEF